MITTIYSFGKKAIELLMVFANNHGNGLSTVLTIVHYIHTMSIKNGAKEEE